jgi:ATP-dependent DNA helicase PIF1
MLFFRCSAAWSSVPAFTTRAYTKIAPRMLRQAIQQCSPPVLPSASTKTQKSSGASHLHPTCQKSSPSKKRKLGQAMSNTRGGLGALHMTNGFCDENASSGDAASDLPRDRSSVMYPSLPDAASNVDYPSLPAKPTQESSSLPWSSSPPEHHQPPPRKRRTIPWPKEQERATAPSDQAFNSSYLFSGNAGAAKNKQSQSRKPSRPQTGTVNQLLLSNEQKAILTAVVDKGKSVFFTGSAGTGKSVLMRSIIKKLRDRYIREPDRLGVTASTGLAAVNIDGVTLHSFAGIGLGKEPAAELVKKIKRNPKNRTRWSRTKVLIIDEVSMIDGDLFDKLEQIARMIRGNGSPFGGIQLVITGDFFQLPPVPERDRLAKFAFDATTWNTCIEHTILLTDVFRQKDANFANMLNEMRLGRLSQPSIQAFRKLSRPLNFADDLEATEL